MRKKFIILNNELVGKADIKNRSDKIDGIFALFLSFVLFASYVLLMNYYLRQSFTGHKMLYLKYLLPQLIICLVIVGIIFLYTKARKQSLASLGLSFINVKASILDGLKFSLLFFTFFMLIHIISDDFNIHQDFKLIIISFVYFLFLVAIFEEFVFRAFIQQRLYGLIKNKMLNLIIVGLIFSLMHMPMRIMNFVGSTAAYFSQNWMHHLLLFFFHLFFNFLYEKRDNIIGPSIVHFIYNYMQFIFLGF